MALQIWLPLNGNLTQQGLSGVQPNVSSLTYTTGKIGQCLLLDNQIDTALPATNWDYVTNSCSFGCWVKVSLADLQTIANGKTFDSTNSTMGGTLLGKDSYGGVALRWKTNNLSSSKTITQVTLYGHIRNTNSNYQVTNSYVLPFDTWTHVVLVINRSTQTMGMYINGKLFNEKGIGGVTGTFSTGNFLICQSSWDGGNGVSSPGKFSLNDVRVYDHALSAKEVKELAKGLVLHYRLAGPGQENFILESHKVTSGSAATGITRNYTSEGYLKVVSTSGNGNWCSVGFAKDSNANVGNKLSVGDTYTMSVEIKVENGTILPSIFINDGNSYKRLQGTIKINQWVQYSYTAVWNAPGTSYGNISLHLGFSGAIGTYYFRNFKLEKGSVATPWCPAPGDTLYTTLGYNNNIEYDCSGFGNNGTKSGAEMIWDINSPRYTTSYKFIGSGQKISVAKKIVPQLTNATFSVWFYRSDYGSQPWESLITIANDPVNNVNNYFEIETKYSSTNDTNIRVYNGAGTPVIKTNAYELNKWTHVAVTLNSTQIKLYINGELVSTGTSHTLPDKANYCIGSYPSGSQSFKGNISDARIYVTELSAEDIAELYHSAVIVDNTGKSYAYEYFEA